MIPIINETSLRTCDLRRFVTRCVNLVANNPKEKRKIARLSCIHFENNSKRAGDDAVGGYAYFWGPAYIFVKKDKLPAKWRLAKVIAHELGHVKGLDHAAMSGLPKYGYGPSVRSDFEELVADLPLRLKEKKVITLDEKRAERLRRAEANLARWETKLRRATNAVRKWKAETKRIARYNERAALKD